MRYLITVFYQYSLEVGLSFLINSGVSDVGEVTSSFLPPLENQDNSKFNISFVFKISVVFYTTRRYLNLPQN